MDSHQNASRHVQHPPYLQQRPVYIPSYDPRFLSAGPRPYRPQPVSGNRSYGPNYVRPTLNSNGQHPQILNVGHVPNTLNVVNYPSSRISGGQPNIIRPNGMIPYHFSNPNVHSNQPYKTSPNLANIPIHTVQNQNHRTDPNLHTYVFPNPPNQLNHGTNQPFPYIYKIPPAPSKPLDMNRSIPSQSSSLPNSQSRTLRSSNPDVSSDSFEDLYDYKNQESVNQPSLHIANQLNVQNQSSTLHVSNDVRSLEHASSSSTLQSNEAENNKINNNSNEVKQLKQTSNRNFNNINHSENPSFEPVVLQSSLKWNHPRPKKLDTQDSTITFADDDISGDLSNELTNEITPTPTPHDPDSPINVNSNLLTRTTTTKSDGNIPIFRNPILPYASIQANPNPSPSGSDSQSQIYLDNSQLYYADSYYTVNEYSKLPNAPPRYEPQFIINDNTRYPVYRTNTSPQTNYVNQQPLTRHTSIDMTNFHPHDFTRRSGLDSNRHSPDINTTNRFKTMGEIKRHSNSSQSRTTHHSASELNPSSRGSVSELLTKASTLTLSTSNIDSLNGPNGESLYEYREKTKKSNDPMAQFEYSKYIIRLSQSMIPNSQNTIKQVRKTQEILHQEALKWIKKLATLGKNSLPEAQFYLAECYGNGNLGLTADHEKAFNLYMQASKLSHPAATYRIAVCYEVGAGTKRDIQRAVQFYRKAGALGDPSAMYKLGTILLNGTLGQTKNIRESITWLKRAARLADSENPHALYELALLYEGKYPETENVIITDPSYAYDLTLNAAELGYAPAQYKLGISFEYGGLGLVIDPGQSIFWYRKAAEQGDPESELALSGWYLTGSEHYLPQSDQEAYKWARKAGDKGLAKAEYAVGYYCENGIGVIADIQEARKWYLRASSQGNKRAITRLTELNGQESKSFRKDIRKEKDGDCLIM